MALSELIDTIDSLLSSGASISTVRSQLVVLREQAEALEESLSAAETPPQDDASASREARLQTMLNEAFDEIERLGAAAHQNKKAEHDAKLTDIQAAVAQGRPVCHCTQTGEVMLLSRYGLSSRRIYKCPECKRTEKANVPPDVS